MQSHSFRRLPGIPTGRGPYSLQSFLRRSAALGLPPIMRARPHWGQVNLRCLCAEWGSSLILILHLRQNTLLPFAEAFKTFFGFRP